MPATHRAAALAARVCHRLARWGQGLLAAASLVAAPAAFAASVPTGFVDKLISGGLTSPTAMTVLPDDRVLVVQQNGVIRVIKGDAMLGTNFYAVANVDTFAERGCLGIVPDPGFATNHFVYIYCTVKNATGSNNRVLRVTEANDRVVAGSERVILDLPNVPGSTKFHMGGALRFGVDGKLYIAVGNHEDSVQTPANSNAQKLTNPFGKILRINADGTVPSDNPFFNTAGAYRANYALGFRNPFALDIQPGTGLTYVNDVGQGSWEEINRLQAAGNYGWPAVEGNGNDARYINPVFAYSHGVGCAITGGQFYNTRSPQQFPASFTGRYFYADFCNGTIRTISPANPGAGAQNFASGIGNPIALGITANGAMFYLARNQGTGTPQPGAGTVSKITFTGSQAPRITQHPQSRTVFVGDPVTFTVAADGATGFQWQRNGANIAGATSTSFTIASTTTGDNGARFRAVASNGFGNTPSDEATLTVTTNRAPTATIDTPSASTGFAPGETINFSGTATDAEDGTLPASAFTWQVDFQHDAHAHNFIQPFSGQKSGSFVVSDLEATEANTWLRITLTVRDSSGNTTIAHRDIFPRTQVSALTLVGTPINGFGPVEMNRSNGESAAGDGRTITIAGIPYQRGMGTHAPSDVRFNLAGACSGSFISDVGVDDEVGSQGSVVFQVFLDGVKAYDSGIVRGADLRKSVNVSVAGKNELRLVVTDAGDGKSFDHADWAGAKVTGCGAGPTPTLNITNLIVNDGANAADWSVQNNLQVGNNVYGDRAFTFTAIPSDLLGAKWVRTANDSKTFTGNPTVTFGINVSANVYVAFNNSAAVPSWVDESWTDTGTDITTRESATATRTYSVYRKTFPAGTVSLGAWGNTASMYLVVVK